MSNSNVPQALRRAALILAALLGILAIPFRAARAQCPTDSVSYCSNVTTSSNSALSFNCFDCYLPNYLAGNGSYDLALGMLSVRLNNTQQAYATVDVEDVYVVSGIAPSAPLDFTARLVYSGTAGFPYAYGAASGSGRIRLVGGVQNQVSFACSQQCVQPYGNLDVPVQVVAGAPFRIHCGVEAGAANGATGEMWGHLTFVGLPGGASIMSCQGYRQDFPVPALPMSWGALKLLYR